MNFKAWLFNEIEPGVGGLLPEKPSPQDMLRGTKGACPTADLEPLPGNKRPMKKKMERK